MPNLFAYVVLYTWPLVVILLFRVLPRTEALIWSIVGGYLLLPNGVGIDPPLLPTLDKTFVTSVSTALVCFWVVKTEKGQSRASQNRDARQAAAIRPDTTLRDGAKLRPVTARTASQRLPYSRQRTALPVRTEPQFEAVSEQPFRRARGLLVANGIMIFFVLMPVLTVLTNRDAVVVGVRYIPGLGLNDALSMMIDITILAVPFLLGRFFIASPEQHVSLLRVLCIAGLIYSLPALFEIRMSPQLSRWTYGFLSQSFAQAMRDGGFRPVVFLQHGLWLAIFLSTTALAAFALWRDQRGTGRSGKYFLAGIWLTGVLLLCHSLGAVVILAALLPLLLITGPRIQFTAAAVIAAIILTYPVLRGSGALPLDFIKSTVTATSMDRAQSLEFRLDNEDELLTRANLKPMFGWGGWGRPQIYDPWSGKSQTVSDGIWIIVIGVFGWAGYLSEFGLLTLPIFLLALRRRQLNLTFATVGLCMILTANLIDLIPNATLTPVTWLVAGSLLGRYGYQSGSGSRRMATSRGNRRQHRPASDHEPATVT